MTQTCGPICFVFTNIFQHTKLKNTHDRGAHRLDYIKNMHWGAEGLCVCMCACMCTRGEGQISQAV